MIDIPENIPNEDDFESKVDYVCEGIANEIQRQRDCNFKSQATRTATEHCYGGGHPMKVIYEVAKRFAAKGWYCYLVRGGTYNNWTWLVVQNTEHPEGYTEATIPSYYERVR